MKIRNTLGLVMALSLILMMAVPPAVFAQDAGGKAAFKQEELDQILAPIALYPDSLLTQVMMASTYPLEIVQADRWAKQNKDMKGDALVKALEAQTWDLGKNTSKAAEAMKRFDPDRTWKKVE
jgi:hypothetical protein